MEYIPECWVLCKIKSDQHPVYYRVFAGWRGGYTSSDWWKLSSGGTDVFDGGEYYEIPGSSGSVYKCYKTCYGITGYYLNGVLKNIIEDVAPEGVTVTVMTKEEIDAVSK